MTERIMPLIITNKYELIPICLVNAFKYTLNKYDSKDIIPNQAAIFLKKLSFDTFSSNQTKIATIGMVCNT